MHVLTDVTRFYEKKFKLFVKFNCVEEALSHHGNWIYFIDEQTEEMQMNAVNKNADLKVIKNPSEKIQLLACKVSRYNFYLIENPSEEFILKALKLDGTIIEYVENPTKEMQIVALENGAKIENIKDLDNSLMIKLKGEIVENIGKFLELEINDNICKGCEVVCVFKHSTGLFDGCPRFLEHITLMEYL